MRVFWQFFLTVLMGTSVVTAEITPCREWKPGVTECDPYSGRFLRINPTQKRIDMLRNRPVTKREIPITQKIRVKNGITLDNLIRKYIKREERLYKKALRERNQKRYTGNRASLYKKISANSSDETISQKREEIPLEKSETETEKSPKQEISAKSQKPIKHKEPSLEKESLSQQEPQQKEKPHTSMVQQPLPERVAEQNITQNQPAVSPQTEKPLKLLIIEETEPKPLAVSTPKSNQTETVGLSKPIVLASPSVQELNQSAKVERDIPQKSKPKEEEILPAELIPDQNQTEMEIKQSIEKEFAVYVVQKGESLASIAQKFGVEIQNLIAINHLDKKHTLKVGQKLRIPLPQGEVDAIAMASYVVKRGDTLSKIAKRFHVKIKDIVKYNRIKKRSLIHVGQKLILPLPHKLVELKRIEERKRKAKLKKKREREKLARLALKKRKKERFLRESKKFKRKLSVVATAYTSHRGQTDRTPFLAAWNNRIRPGMKVIAVSRDLIYKYGITNGSKVRISGLKGIYTVRDKMNKKWRRKIDIYMGTNRWRALRWGKRRVTLYY